MFSFLSTNEGERYLKGLHRRDSSMELEYMEYTQGWKEGWKEGEALGAYKGLVNILRHLFKEEPAEIEAILRKKDAQKLMQLQHIAFDSGSYEEFVRIVKSEETRKRKFTACRLLFEFCRFRKSTSDLQDTKAVARVNQK